MKTKLRRKRSYFPLFTLDELHLTLRKGVLILLRPYPPPGGGTPLYQVYRYVGYVPPQRVWFLSRFGLKTDIDFEHFGLKLGMVIGETFTKAYFPSQQPDE